MTDKEMQMKDTHRKLINILADHCGETGENEGAVETLERLLREHDCPLKK